MIDLVNWQQEEPTGYGGGRQLSLDGTSRVIGDCHARICERLGVKLLGRLGGGQRWSSLPRTIDPKRVLENCNALRPYQVLQANLAADNTRHRAQNCSVSESALQWFRHARRRS